MSENIIKPERRKPGPKTKDEVYKLVKTELAKDAIEGQILIGKLIRGEIKRCSENRFKAAVLAIEQTIGKARIQLDHTSGGKSLSDIAKAFDKRKEEETKLVESGKIVDVIVEPVQPKEEMGNATEQGKEQDKDAGEARCAT